MGFRFLRRLSYLWRQRQMNADLAHELEFHREMKQGELEQAGMAASEAEYASRRALGNPTLAREDARAVWIWRWVDDLSRDVIYAGRTLRRHLAFSVVCVSSLALGIGANATIFTLFHAILLKPLPVNQPDRLVFFTSGVSEGTATGSPSVGRWDLFSFAAYNYLRDQTLPFQGIAAIRSGEATVSLRIANDTRPVQYVQGHLVSDNYFDVMGVQAAFGRTLTLSDDQLTAAPVAVVSDSFWKQRLDGERNPVGKVAILNGVAFTIVGVMPPGFFGERVRRPPDVWMPLAFQTAIERRPSFLDRTDVYWLNLVGRLPVGASRAEAQVAATSALQRFLTITESGTLSDERRREIRESYIELADGSRGVFPLRQPYAEPLQIVMGAVGLVLLITSVNVGNLLLARARRRRAEMAMRVALGATRMRLVRQLLTESLLLAVLGGVSGIVLAYFMGSALLALMVGTTNPLRASLEMPVILFTAVVTCLAGVLSTISLVIHIGDLDLMSALKSGSRGGTRRVGVLRPGRGLLVVAQIAASLVLLVGASLFMRTMVNLENADLGFDPEDIVIARINPRLAGYAPREAESLYRRLLDRLEAMPEIRAATVASYSPFSGSSSRTSADMENRSTRSVQHGTVQRIFVGPWYPDTLGIPVVRGRSIGDPDRVGAPKVVMVNEAFVRQFVPDDNPLGHRLSFDGPASLDFEIVGVLKDAEFYDVNGDTAPTVYPALLQDSSESALAAEVEVRTAQGASGTEQVRAAIQAVDPNLPVTMRTLQGQLSATFNQQRLTSRVVAFFSGLALVLASIGLYGVMSQSVAERTNELGVRMVLGAVRTDVFLMIFRGAAIRIAAGIALGTLAATATVRLISSQLYGVPPHDPLSFTVAIGILCGVGAFAAAVPALRATRADPMVALRCE